MKKNKKIFQIMLLLTCLICMCLFASGMVQAANGLPYVVDDSDLLSDEEEAALTDKLQDISERQKCDVIVVTNDSLEGKTSEAYADDFFDYNGYGYGSQYDGILFLVSMEERDWAISTCGNAIAAFTDAGQEYMTDRIVPMLTDGEYNKAFNTYADLCDQFLTQAASGKPYTADNLPKDPVSLLWIPLSLLIGAVISFLITTVMKSSLKTVRSQTRAAEYLQAGSMRISLSRDIFINRTTSKTRKQEKSSSGGGSSTHTSSSGQTHGGSSGKF